MAPHSDFRFTQQLLADDLVLVAECESDLQAAVAAWGFKFRFTFGIGPTKSAVMVFRPRRNLPTCSVTLGGVELPVVSMYKCLGVVLTPTLHWTQHAQHLVQRGNRLFAQCVFWCRSERLPLAMASSIFMVYVLPSVSWGTEFFSHSPPALRQLDHALRQWGRFLLGWPSGLPSAGMLAELGWPDAERLSTGRLLSLSQRACAFLGGPRYPLLEVSSSLLQVSQEVWAHHAQELCLSVGAVIPHMCGVVPGCLPSLARRWFDSQVRPFGQRFSPDPVGDFFHCLCVCPAFNDLRAQWCPVFLCRVPLEFIVHTLGKLANGSSDCLPDELLSAVVLSF